MIIKNQFKSNLTLPFIISGVTIVLISSFITSKQLMNDTVVAKEIWFYASMALFLVIFGIVFLLKKQLKVTIGRTVILLLIYYGYSVIRLFIHPLKDGLLNELLMLSLPVLFYLVLGYLLQEYRFKLLQSLTTLLLLTGLLHALHGLLQLYGFAPSHNSNYNLTGVFFNPAPYAAYIMTILPLAIGLYLSEQKETGYWYIAKKVKISRQQVLKYTGFISLVAIILVLPVTRSRSAWLGAMLGCGIVLAYRYSVLNKLSTILNTTAKKTIAIILLVFILFAGSYGLYQYKKDSAFGRLLVWKVSLQMVKDKSIVGFGPNGFPANYALYQANYFESGQGSAYEEKVAGNERYAFNEYLQLMVEKGAIGLFLFMAWLISGIIGFIRNKEKTILGYAYLGGLLGLLVFAGFSYPFEFVPLQLQLFVFMAVLGSMVEKREREVRLNFATRIFPLLLIIPLNILILNKAKEKYLAYKGWKEAWSSYQMGMYDISAEEYSEVYHALNGEGQYLLNYGKCLSLAGKHQESIERLNEAGMRVKDQVLYTTLGDNYKTLGKIKEAEKAYWKAHYMMPSRFYPKYLLAKLYDESGQAEKAKTLARELLEKKVKVESTAIKEIHMEMKKILDT